MATKSKASLDFAVFGISFALAAADEIKREFEKKSLQWNWAESVEYASNRLLDSVAPSGPGHVDSANASALFDKFADAAARAKITRSISEYRVAFSISLLDDVKRKAPMKSHQWNRAEAMEKALHNLLKAVSNTSRGINIEKAKKLFDAMAAEVMKMYAQPKPLPVRGKDGRFRRAAEVAA